MIKRKGSELRVLIKTAPNTYEYLKGERSATVTFPNEQVETTVKGDGWRSLSPCGIKSVEFTASGVIRDDTNSAHWNLLMQSAFGGAEVEVHVVSGEDVVVGATCIVTSIERTGEHNGAETYSVSFASGALAYIDYGVIYTGGPTRDPTDGTPVYWNGGLDIPPGRYTVLYEGGGTSFSNLVWSAPPAAPHPVNAFFAGLAASYGTTILVGPTATPKYYWVGTYPDVAEEQFFTHTPAAPGLTQLSCNVPGYEIPALQLFLSAPPQRQTGFIISVIVNGVAKSQTWTNEAGKFFVDGTTTPGYLTINFVTPLLGGETIAVMGALYVAGWFYATFTATASQADFTCNAAYPNDIPWMDGTTTFSYDVLVNGVRKLSTEFTVSDDGGFLKVTLATPATLGSSVIIRTHNPTITEGLRSNWYYADYPGFLLMSELMEGMSREIIHPGGPIGIKQFDTLFTDNWGQGLAYRLIRTP